MDNTMIKRLYEEAATLHTQAMDILKEFEGKDMPKDKAGQVDTLLDQVEAKSQEAKRLERAADADKLLNDPVTQKAFFQASNKNQGDAADLKAAFNAFAREGIKGMSDAERKSLFVGDVVQGGYLVSDTYLNTILVAQRASSVMRQISRVLPPVPSGSVIVPTEADVITSAVWTTELATAAEDTVAAPFGRKTLTPHPLSKLILVSNTFLRNPTFDVEAWVRERMAYKFNIPEEYAFINGTGVAQPLGLLNTPSLPTYTTAAALTVTADDLINWAYRLPAGYVNARTRIICNRAFIRKVRLLKDGNGQYLWQPGLQAGLPGTILDTSYVFSDQFDDGLDATTDAWEANAVIAVIGDFDYYWIVDALGLTIQRVVELYALTNQTGFIGRKEVDGMAVLAEAFYALKVHA